MDREALDMVPAGLGISLEDMEVPDTSQVDQASLAALDMDQVTAQVTDLVGIRMAAALTICCHGL
jgi:hypothetical protein